MAHVTCPIYQPRHTHNVSFSSPSPTKPFIYHHQLRIHVYLQPCLARLNRHSEPSSLLGEARPLPLQSKSPLTPTRLFLTESRISTHSKTSPTFHYPRQNRPLLLATKILRSPRGLRSRAGTVCWFLALRFLAPWHALPFASPFFRCLRSSPASSRCCGHWAHYSLSYRLVFCRALLTILFILHRQRGCHSPLRTLAPLSWRLFSALASSPRCWLFWLRCCR